MAKTITITSTIANKIAALINKNEPKAIRATKLANQWVGKGIERTLDAADDSLENADDQLKPSELVGKEIVVGGLLDFSVYVPLNASAIPYRNKWGLYPDELICNVILKVMVGGQLEFIRSE